MNQFSKVLNEFKAACDVIFMAGGGGGGRLPTQRHNHIPKIAQIIRFIFQ